MENTENTFTENASTPLSQPKWFHNAWLSRSTLLIAALFFFLPFININCSGNKLASIKGTDMVFGNELKQEGAKPEEKIEEKTKEIIPSSVDSLTKSISQAADSLSASFNLLGDSLAKGLDAIGDSLEKGIASMKNDIPLGMPNDMMGGKDKKIEPNALAISAFGFVFLALVFSFFKKRAMMIISGALSLLSAIALFFIQVQIADEFKKQMGPFNFIPITFEFTSFYWLCLIFLVIASVFSFVRSSFKVS